MTDKDLITAHVLAEKLGLSVDTIWRYTREKKIPYIQLGKKQYRYRLFDVIKALNDHTVKESKAVYKTNTNSEITYEDYLKIPEEPGYQYEVLEGNLIMEPSPGVTHQRVSRRLQRILEDYFYRLDSPGEVFNAPLDVTLSDTTVVQPDIFYIAGNQSEIVKENRIDGPPMLVVEILSPYNSRKDRVQKMEIYRKARIKHYWLVDPEARTMECFKLSDGAYAFIASGMDEDIVKHPDIADLSISLKKLW